MNCIHIIDSYYLRSDPLNWIVSKKNENATEAKYAFSNISFHYTPKQAISSLAERLCKEDNCTTLADVLKKAESRFPALSRALAEAELITETLEMENDNV